jgi:hypothetical protein
LAPKALVVVVPAAVDEAAGTPENPFSIPSGAFAAVVVEATDAPAAEKLKAGVCGLAVVAAGSAAAVILGNSAGFLRTSSACASKLLIVSRMRFATLAEAYAEAFADKPPVLLAVAPTDRDSLPAGCCRRRSVKDRLWRFEAAEAVCDGCNRTSLKRATVSRKTGVYTPAARGGTGGRKPGAENDPALAPALSPSLGEKRLGNAP